MNLPCTDSREKFDSKVTVSQLSPEELAVYRNRPVKKSRNPVRTIDWTWPKRRDDKKKLLGRERNDATQ